MKITNEMIHLNSDSGNVVMASNARCPLNLLQTKTLQFLGVRIDVRYISFDTLTLYDGEL